MFRKFFDPFKTVKHVSYGEMKTRSKMDQQRTENFFKFILTAVLVIVVIIFIAQWLLH